MKTKFDYDLIIIGSGSAGLPTGMYAARYKIKNLVIAGQPGGALATSHKVENYPGVLSAPGAEIMGNFREHAIASGSEILDESVTKLEKLDEGFKITTTSNKELTAGYVVLATGNKYRHLGFTGEDEFLGKWVSYCATCDGMFFKDRDVVIVGGGNTAFTEALYLAELCKKVYLVHRSDKFRAEDIWIDQAKKIDNIEIITFEEVESVDGSLFMEHVNLKSGKVLNADGIFVAIGSDANTQLVSDFNLEQDDEGCLVVDQRQETTLPGLYAAGDVTTNSNKFKQTIMSAAEWCLAANSIHEDMLKSA